MKWIFSATLLVALITGETLGGSEIQNDGSWNGKWTTPPTDKPGIFAVKVPGASAVVIKLSGN
jgi:hypothetical protein